MTRRGWPGTPRTAAEVRAAADAGPAFHDGLGVGAALVAVALPWLLAWNLPPSSTFLNQAIAFGGWGALLALRLAVAGPVAASPPGRRAGAPVVLALALLGGAAAASGAFGSLPSPLALSALGTLAAALLVFVGGLRLARAEGAEAALAPVALAMLVGGLGSAVVAAIQVGLPAWADGAWVAASALPGRASGNLRQPNHLATLSLWALVALAWLVQRRRVGGAAGLFFGLALVMGVVLSFSRTGTVGIVLLGAWGLVALGWSARVRAGLAVLPLLYAAGWWLVTHLARHGEDAAARFTTHGDISSSRFAIWSDTLALIRARPWTGVGWGEFNFAWSLTPSPQRPVAFFDHTHNLPLQFAVELGLPLALLVLGLLGWALWRLVVTAVRAAGRGPRAPEAQALALLVLLMAVHSQLEYPLWYAYFLLPTAFAWGLGLGAWAGHLDADAGAGAGPGRAAGAGAGAGAAAGAFGPPEVVAATAGARAARRPLATIAAAVAMVVASLLAVADYGRVVVIFAPPPGAGPLDARIRDGQRSLLFAHHAHYAAATSAPQPGEAMVSFRVASHYLLDTRLMTAWARAWHAVGDDARARHLADRLREFRNPASQAFLVEACADEAPGGAPRQPPAVPTADGPAAAAARPFQCEPAPRRLDDRDFR